MEGGAPEEADLDEVLAQLVLHEGGHGVELAQVGGATLDRHGNQVQANCYQRVRIVSTERESSIKLPSYNRIHSTDQQNVHVQSCKSQFQYYFLQLEQHILVMCGCDGDEEPEQLPHARQTVGRAA